MQKGQTQIIKRNTKHGDINRYLIGKHGKYGITSKNSLYHIVHFMMKDLTDSAALFVPFCVMANMAKRGLIKRDGLNNIMLLKRQCLCFGTMESKPKLENAGENQPLENFSTTGIEENKAMKIPFFAIDTPADVLLLNAILENRQVQKCSEWDNVKHLTKYVDGQAYELPICPSDCVKSVDDVQQKCGIKYSILTEHEKQQWREQGGHP